MACLLSRVRRYGLPSDFDVQPGKRRGREPPGTGCARPESDRRLRDAGGALRQHQRRGYRTRRERCRSGKSRSLMWEAVAIVAIVVGILLWVDSLRAREHAVQAGRSACERYQLQFLDDTVSFARIRLPRNEHGELRIAR